MRVYIATFIFFAASSVVSLAGASKPIKVKPQNQSIQKQLNEIQEILEINLGKQDASRVALYDTDGDIEVNESSDNTL